MATANATAGDKRKTKPNFQPIPPAPKTDPFYGHESIACLCARFITHLFACPEYPPNSTVNRPQTRLPYFIAYALHRTKLHPSVTFAALVLLQRLKARFPSARGSSGHRLFVSAFMIASKVICDDTYSNKSWSIVAQGMFSLREINQMEREMCNYLDWELTVDNPILNNFEAMVTRDFADDASNAFPTYALQQVSKRAARAAASTSATPIPEPEMTTSHIPSFGQRNNSTESDSYPASPMTPETPSPSYSTSSPASSASPATPVSVEDLHYQQQQQHERYAAKLQKLNEAPVPVHLPPNADVRSKVPRELSMAERENTTLKSYQYGFAIPVAW